MADKPLTIGEAMRKHWPEYLMEAWGLGAFMVSAGLITTVLEYSNSPIHQAIENADLRRMLIGLGMGLTAIAIIYSPWGKQSGAHLNPAVTLTFLRLGKVKALDAVFYIIAQFVGGALGVLLTWAVLGSAFAEPPVDFVNTKPGVAGPVVAYLTELAMAFGIMLMVLTALASGRLMRFIGALRRPDGRHLHCGARTALRHEHQPGAQLRLGAAGVSLGLSVDLLHRPGRRNAAGGRGVSPGQAWP